MTENKKVGWEGRIAEGLEKRGCLRPGLITVRLGLGTTLLGENPALWAWFPGSLADSSLHNETRQLPVSVSMDS